MGTLGDLMEYWVNPRNTDQRSVQQLQSFYPQQAPAMKPVEYGAMFNRAPNAQPGAGFFQPQMGVREFARQNGIEDLLQWNQENQQVTLGGMDVPYSFGMQGRTYAGLDVLMELLQKVQAMKALEAKQSASISDNY
jgi:hypothetical protein